MAIQTIIKDSPAFLIGVFDGHGGANTACHAAVNVCRIFIEQCVLKISDYALQELSVHNNKAAYKRDNPHCMYFDNYFIEEEAKIEIVACSV